MRKIAISLISALTLIATGQTAQAFHPASAPERIVPAAAVPSYITMDENSGQYTLHWRGQPDKVVIRWKLMAVDGEIVVCGNYALVGHSNRRLSLKALGDTSVMMDRRPLVEKATAFNEISNAQALVGSKAKCIRSGVAAPSDPRAHTFSIGNPKSMYRD